MKDNKNGFGKAVGIGLASILCLSAVTVAPIKKAVDTGKADKKQIESQSTRIADLEKENNIFEADKNSLLEANRELSNKNNTLAEKNQELTEKNSALENDKQDLANKNNQLTQDKENLTNANNQLAQEKENLTNANNQLAQDKENLTNANNQLIQDKENLTNANNQLAQDKQDLTNTNNQLTQDKENLTNANNQLTQDNATLVQEKQELQSQLDSALVPYSAFEVVEFDAETSHESISAFLTRIKTLGLYVKEQNCVTYNGTKVVLSSVQKGFNPDSNTQYTYKFVDSTGAEFDLADLTTEQLDAVRDWHGPVTPTTVLAYSGSAGVLESITIKISLPTTINVNGYGLASLKNKTFTYNDSSNNVALSNPTVISDNNDMGISVSIDDLYGWYAFEKVTLQTLANGTTMAGRFIYNADTDELAFLKLWREEMVGTVYKKYACNRYSETSFALLDPDTGAVIDTFRISKTGGFDELPGDIEGDI